MKISEKERTILACAEFQADAPAALIAKQSGYREHTVRYALRSLADRKVITPIPFINLHKLGLTIYSMFFTVTADSRGVKESIKRALMDSPDVLWVGEFGGEYQYALGYAADRFSTLMEFLRGISKRFPAIFHEKTLAIQISSTIFPRRYLTSKKIAAKPITVSFDKELVEIDSLDKRILSALTRGGNTSHRQVALNLQIPLSTLELRVKKLEKQKIIAGNIFLVAPELFGYQSYKLLVYTKGLDPTISAELKQFCSTHLYITYLIDLLGGWGYEIGVEVHGPDQVTAIIQEIYDKYGTFINTIKILTKFSYPKARWFPEVDGKE